MNNEETTRPESQAWSEDYVISKLNLVKRIIEQEFAIDSSRRQAIREIDRSIEALTKFSPASKTEGEAVDWDRSLSRICHELAGSASLCWKPKPEGVFDTETAIKFVEGAIAELRTIGPPKPAEGDWVNEVAKHHMGDT